MSKSIATDKRAPRAERVAQHRANMKRLGELLAVRRARRAAMVQP
jgi:hypothetical protein